MTRWLLTLLFAFGSVTFLTACEEESEVEEAADEAGDKIEEGIDDAGDAIDDATD